MKLFFKIIGYSLATIVALVVIAFLALQFISDEQYKKWIAGAAESATGRTLAINGEFDMQIGTKLGILAHDLSFANADWGSREEMVSAERLLVQLRLLPLFKGVLDVTVEVDGPDILLETDAAGKANWVFPASATQPEPGAEEKKKGDEGSFALPLKPYIRNFEIKDLVFSFNDGAQDKTIEAAAETLRIYVDDTNIPLLLKATYREAPIELNGSLGNIEEWYANQKTDIALKGRLNEANLGIEGSAGPMLPSSNAELKLALTADNVATFSPFTPMSLPSLQGLDVSLTVVAEDGHLSTKDLEINLADPRLLLAASGNIADLSEKSGIDLKTQISSEHAAELIKELNLDIPYSLPQTVKLKADVGGDLGQLAVQGLELIVKDPGLDITLTGSVEDLFGPGKGAADLHINLESTAIIGSYIGQDLPEFGPFTASAKVSSGEKAVQLESLLVELNDPVVSAKISGSAQSIGRRADGKFDMQGIDLQADAGSTQLQDFVAKFGVEVPGELPASFDLRLSSSGSLEKLGVTELQAVVKDDGVDVNLSGTIDNVLDVSGIAAQLNAALDNTAKLSKYAGFDLPALGSLQLAGKVLSAGETYRLENLELGLDGEATKVKVTGAVQDLLALTKVGENSENYGKAGIEASANAEAASLAELLKLANIEIAEIGALKLGGRLKSSANSLRLDDLEVALDGDAAKVQVTGTVQDLLALTKVGENPENYGRAGIEASVNAEAASVADLLKLANIEIDEIGALKFDGQLMSAAGSLRLDSLNASLVGDGFNTKAQASMADVIGLTGLTAVIDGDLQSLSSLSDLAKKQLPETGPWVVHIQADANDLSKRQMTFSANLEGEGIKAAVDADLPDVRAPQTFQTQLAVDVDSIARLGELLGKPVTEDMPLALTARVNGEPGSYQIDGFLVKAQDSEIRADLTYLTPPASERNNLSGAVTINNFDFVPFLTAKEEEGEIEKAEAETPAEVEEKKTPDEEQETEKPAKGKKIFSSEPLAVGALQDYDVDLKIDATNALLRGDITLDGELAVKLDHGFLTIDPLQLKESNGGTGIGHITLDTSAPVAKLDAEVTFDDFVSPRFGGLFDVIIDLDGSGKSVAELMGSLNGQFVASVKEVELHRSFMSQFGAGLLKQLNPLDSDKTVLECAVVRFDITDGIADFEKKIAAQTSEVTWFGGGEINLKTEELDLGISPKARGALSALTNIDLASLVHIGGTLAEPKIGLDVADVAKKYAGYTAFVATGGLSFLAQKVVETTQANMNQCERILKDLEEKQK